MLHTSLTAAVLALATVVASTSPGSAQTSSPASAAAASHNRTVTASHNSSRTPVHYRTIVHHVYTYEPAPEPYYYGPDYGPSYAPAPPVVALPAAAACVALSLIGGC